MYRVTYRTGWVPNAHPEHLPFPELTALIEAQSAKVTDYYQHSSSVCGGPPVIFPSSFHRFGLC